MLPSCAVLAADSSGGFFSKIEVAGIEVTKRIHFTEQMKGSFISKFFHFSITFLANMFISFSVN